MDKLKQQVAKARRRLGVQQFLGVLVWCWFSALVAAALAIGVQKTWLTGIDGWQWAAWWLAGAVGVGLVAAAFWTLWHRRRELDAAIELDRRFGLKERVSSSLALEPDLLDSPAGRALVADAQQRVSKIEVAERFPVTLARRSWLPVAPAVVAFGLCLLADPTRPDQAGANTLGAATQIKKSTEPLRRKVEERSKQAGEKGLKDAEDLFKKFEEGMRNLAKNNEDDRREALTKLNDLARQLDDRREKLAEGDKLKQQLAQMKSLPSGPADKLAQDLKSGRFDRALKELDKLKDQLASGQLDPEKQQELARQLAAMQESLQKMADAHKKMQEELQQELEKALQSGDKQAAKKIQDQLKQLQLQQPGIDRLSSLANKLGQCGAAMKEGKTGQAQAALSQMSSELAQLQQEAEEMQLLDVTLDEVADAKAAMSCKFCEGAGCQACNNGGDGLGPGEGGYGARPENPHDTKFYDSKVRQNVGKGAAVVTGLVDGPNAKGQVLEEIKGQLEAARRESSDPLTGQRLPRQQRDHVQQYFDALRQGK